MVGWVTQQWLSPVNGKINSVLLVNAAMVYCSRVLKMRNAAGSTGMCVCGLGLAVTIMRWALALRCFAGMVWHGRGL